MKYALIILCLVLVGCQGRQSPGRYKKTKEDQKWMPSIPSKPAHENYAQAAAVMPNPMGPAIAWDHPGLGSGEYFEVWTSPDLRTWMLAETTTARRVQYPRQTMAFYRVRTADGHGNFSDWATTR